ncbi:MAG: FAD-binding oxidoreductase [Parcubacteria group bacterium]
MKEEIEKFFKGEIRNDEETLKAYSKDASLFEVRPKLAVFPKDTEDLKALVKFVNEKKGIDPTISLSVRAAGTCMSGGSLNESIIADVSKHMNKIGEVSEGGTWVEPGTFYKDFEKRTLEKSLILPCYTASKNLCALGGMLGNNCGGEKTLRYGKMEDYVLESKVIFSDGNEYTVKPLSRDELELKMSQNDFEGDIYKKIHNLIRENKELIDTSKPNVSKNSAGYYLWNVWNDNKFDLNRLLVGSQGTLGLITQAKIKLIKPDPVSKLLVVFLRDFTHLSEVVNVILPTNPESIESYDDATMKLAFKFLPEMIKSMKIKSFAKLLFSFIPEALMMIRGGVPKLILLVEYSGSNEKEVDQKMKDINEKIKKFHFQVRLTHSLEESNKYWTVRRESFNLLRKHTEGRRTAPFVDDVVVRTEHMPEFLPRMREILDDYSLTYTIAGHAGNGNFHIIPLMDMRDKRNIKIIEEVSEKVYDLVAYYKGSITGEHNDGIIRTHHLSKMYSADILHIFERTKDIFDHQSIFNPGKKTGGSKEYTLSHIAVEP